MGLPERWIVLDEKMCMQARVYVRYAGGYAEEFVKGGLTGCGNGATQGAEDGPDKYNMFEDPFNTLWEGMPIGLWIDVSETKQFRNNGAGFVDDKKPISEEQIGLQGWYTASSQYIKFHGSEVRPKKCAHHVQKWCTSDAKNDAISGAKVMQKRCKK